MNENLNPDARLLEHTVQLLRGHARLLADQNRNAAFFAALRQEVKAGAHVVDIGTGTGVWAIAAAKLGAEKVVAIERDPLLLGLIQSLARENAVADRVQVVIGDSRQVQLPPSFDLVISETIGNVGFDEEIWSVLTDARDRFLKSSGRLIPITLSLRAAPARLLRPPNRLPAGLSLNYDPFESLYLNIPATCSAPQQLRLLRPSVALMKTDFRTATAPPRFEELKASWHIEDLGEVNCFAVWPESELTTGIILDTLDTGSWSPIIYRFKSSTLVKGEIEFRLKLAAQSHSWTVTIRHDQSEHQQSYSPATATAEMLAQMKFGNHSFLPQMDANGRESIADPAGPDS